MPLEQDRRAPAALQPGERDDDRLTVYFDGSCPLCRAEIAHYGRQAGAENLCFVDVSADGPETGPDLDRNSAMARFHVRRPDGSLVSGAEGFVEVWARLPRWRRLAALASRPAVLAGLEGAYRLFLPVRPYLSRAFGGLQRLRDGTSSRIAAKTERTEP